MSTDVLLVYPYFNEELDQSIFRYPPLGLGYLASMLKSEGVKVKLLDCTFSTESAAVEAARRIKPRILGIYSMVTINHHAISIAKKLQDSVELLVAGGPLPTLVPDEFLDIFDVVVKNEGEQTFLELVNRHFEGHSWKNIEGIAYRNENGQCHATRSRSFQPNLDSIPFPAREMFPNEAYKKYWRRYHGYTATSQITTRGCPYLCDFCSNPVFGISYRERSARNVVDEMQTVAALGYDRVFFTDDCFTQNPKRVDQICDLLIEERLGMDWMCLSRADRLGKTLAQKMAKAGCVQIFFGIESGNERMLGIMNKRIILEDVREAVTSANYAGISTGGFLILGYPGESDTSLLDSLRFSSSLPLDYLSYSFPYPIVGTGLYTKVRERINKPEWRKQRGKASRHQLLFAGDFSETKLRFAKHKGLIQHFLRRRGPTGAAAASVFERITDRIIPFLR